MAYTDKFKFKIVNAFKEARKSGEVESLQEFYNVKLYDVLDEGETQPSYHAVRIWATKDEEAKELIADPVAKNASTKKKDEDQDAGEGNPENSQEKSPPDNSQEDEQKEEENNGDPEPNPEPTKKDQPGPEPDPGPNAGKKGGSKSSLEGINPWVLVIGGLALAVTTFFAVKKFQGPKPKPTQEVKDDGRGSTNSGPPDGFNPFDQF